MSRLDFCQYELVDDCYDWKNDNCDECNIFKAYCEGARRAKNSIVRCKDCRFAMVRTKEEMNKPIKPQPILCEWLCIGVENDAYCSHGERKEL